MIPEKIPKTPEVSYPISAVQGKNRLGKIGYNGPCPLTGQTHRYFFNIYGLDTLFSLPAGSIKEQLVKSYAGAGCPVRRDLYQLWPVKQVIRPFFSFRFYNNCIKNA